MRVLENLEPKNVFHFFEDLTQIPRPSHHEKAVSDYLMNFAKERGLECYQDDIYNVIIIKEASEGYEDEEPIILQGHMDMVCEKVPGCEKDMEKEGLDLEIDGDYIRAKGTTLGGDDGIAVAYALALLDDDNLRHPRLEFVCTVAEEVGMDGAHAIDCSPLKGHLLLNMDSEDEGIVLAGCAGGGSTVVKLPVSRKAFDGEALKVSLAGLTGGHSGTEINKGRGNASLLLIRALRDAFNAADSRLVSIAGGSKDNAIPSSAEAVVVTKDAAAFKSVIADLAEAFASELSAVDKDVSLTVEAADNSELPLTKADTKKVIALITSLPNGVQRMSDHIDGLVETSLNLGITRLDADGLYLRSSLRSSVGTAFTDLAEKVKTVAEAFGADFTLTGEYPAWEYVEHSVLRDKMARIYKEMFGKDLIIQAIHAGVECGLLAGKIDNLDAISMGPDILDIHTPNEHLSISSTKRMYDYIVKIIETK